MCVTKTCSKYLADRDLASPGVLNETLERCINESIWNEYELQTRLTKVYYCDQKKEEMNIELLDWLVLALFILIIAINVLATAYDLSLDEELKKKASKGELAIYEAQSTIKFASRLIPYHKT